MKSQAQALKTPAASSSHWDTMESLALPQELYWDGKAEPVSPPSTELFTLTTESIEIENWLYDDNFANEILMLTDGDTELKPATQILHGLIDTDEYVVELCSLKEENWPPLTAGVITQIPAYNELDATIAGQEIPTTKDISAQYINFNENILGVGQTLTTLTPPQSPPRNGSLITTLPEQHENIVPVQLHTLHYRPTAESAAVPIANPATSTAYIIPTATEGIHAASDDNAVYYSASNDAEIKNEIEQAQIVDQIIEEFAKDLPDMSDEYESQYSYSPPSQIEEASSDGEWTPPSSAGSSPTRFSSSSSSSISSAGSICGGDVDEEKELTAIVSTKKRTRPYGRGVEDRKIRKKEQNKNAATRYRQKKKLEMELVLTEEQALTKRNDELKDKLNKSLCEIKYLKKLIREFYRNENA